MALFVPLDVNYFEDDKIVAVGPYGELLYIRSLAFVKRARSEGAFTLQQSYIFGAGIPRLSDRRTALVKHRLWEPTAVGWFICGWFNHNPHNTEISAVRRDAGLLGNHRRWHLGPDGTPSSDCKICIANGIA